MGHPLETVIRTSEPFLLIGDSSQERFPGFSYNQFTKAQKRFYCVDLGGLKESRGPTKGGPVYEPDDVPDDHSNLAIIWVKPKRAVEAVEVAQRLGAKRVWFSFQTGHRDAVDKARELDMEVVEIGRCPVYYMETQTGACKGHTMAVKMTGLYAKPPQTDPSAKRRELL